MKLTIRHPRDFWSGVIFMGFAVFALVLARDYSMGTARRMGAGYFPSLLCVALLLIGLILVARSLILVGPAIDKVNYRALLLILTGVVAFGLLLQPLGVVLSTIVLVVISCLGGWEFRWRDVAVLCVTLNILAVGLFVFGLDMQLKVWPW